MVRWIFFIGCLLMAMPVFSVKRALIIAIGEYHKDTGWPAISSVNDVSLIKNALLNQGFDEKEIKVITNEEATKEGILRAFDDLYHSLHEGDIVVVHYSGHGQQVEDLNGDEADGLDEAIVPYDGLMQTEILPDGSYYINQNHLIDDELEFIIHKFRNKLGKQGQLLFILDSCHSGSASRGDGEIRARGGKPPLVTPHWEEPDTDKTDSGSGFFQIQPAGNHPAPFIMISGAAAKEKNYEYGEYGSLSYAFSKAMNELGSDYTYRRLFANIAAIMNGIAPRQRPVVEGDIDYKLFKGEYLRQTSYFEVDDVAYGNQKITINGGQVNSIFNKTTVFVMPKGSTRAEEAKALANGEVTHAGFGISQVELDRALEDDNPKNYWVFIDELTYGNDEISVGVYLDHSVKDKEMRLKISEYLRIENLGKVVSTLDSSDVIIDFENGEYNLSFSRGEGSFGKTGKKEETAFKEITEEISQFARGNYLKNLNFKTSGFEFEFKLKPVQFDPLTGKVSEAISDSVSKKEFDVFQVVPEKDYVVLEIVNRGNRDLYISIVEINSSGEISPFFPGPGCRLTNDDRLLKAGKTMRFNHCVYGFAPPYERLLLKGFASDRPLNFDSSARAEETNTHPLKMFLDDTVLRGSSSRLVPRESKNLSGYTAEFLYEIVKE